MASSCPPHSIHPSDRAQAKASKKGATVTCQDCGKKLRLKPNGESIKDEVQEAKISESVLTHSWDPSDHPRGSNGRFTSLLDKLASGGRDIKVGDTKIGYNGKDGSGTHSFKLSAPGAKDKIVSAGDASSGTDKWAAPVRLAARSMNDSGQGPLLYGTGAKLSRKERKKNREHAGD